MVCPSLVVLSLRQPGLLASSHVTYFGCDHNRVLDDGLSPASASILSIGFLCALSQRYVRVVDAYPAAHINILATWLPRRDSGVKILGDVNISKRICWVGLSVFSLHLLTWLVCLSRLYPTALARPMGDVYLMFLSRFYVVFQRHKTMCAYSVIK